MTPPLERLQAIGISWYRPGDYLRLRAMMVDPEVLPESYQGFLYRAQKAEELARRAGAPTIRVYLDDHDFPAWCRENGYDLDTDGRRTYAARMAARMVEGQDGRSA